MLKLSPGVRFLARLTVKLSGLLLSLYGTVYAFEYLIGFPVPPRD